MKDCDLRKFVLQKYYDSRGWGHLIHWYSDEIKDWQNTVSFSVKDLQRICRQLADHRLIDFYPDNVGVAGGAGRINTRGVAFIEGTEMPPTPNSKTLERIDRNIEAVAKDKYELRKENEDLKRLHAQGRFDFALRVDGLDFQAFAAIMLLGNRKKAADSLKIPHRTFYDRVAHWRGNGSDYKRLSDMVEWRKKSGRKIKVRLEDSLQSGEPSDQTENPETNNDILNKIKENQIEQDRPALFRDILDALRRQNLGNWVSVRDELIGIVSEEIPQ
jgi:hypothetical protein